MKSAEGHMCSEIVLIYDLLYRLGLKGDHTGFFYTSRAVWLAIREPGRLLMVGKWLYPAVAKQYATSCRAIDQGIRLSITKIWDQDPEKMQEVFGVTIREKPSPAKFLSLLVMCCTGNTAA